MSEPLVNKIGSNANGYYCWYSQIDYSHPGAIIAYPYVEHNGKVYKNIAKQENFTFGEMPQHNGGFEYVSDVVSEYDDSTVYTPNQIIVDTVNISSWSGNNNTKYFRVLGLVPVGLSPQDDLDSGVYSLPTINGDIVLKTKYYQELSSQEINPCFNCCNEDLVIFKDYLVSYYTYGDSSDITDSYYSNLHPASLNDSTDDVKNRPESVRPSREKNYTFKL